MTLERHIPLGRGKPIQPGKPLARSAPLKQSGGALRRTAKPKVGPVDTGPARATREDVLDAWDWRCVICGTFADHGQVPFSIHHREGRGSGGRQGAARAESNRLCNLLPLCGTGITGCHGWVTDGAAPGGGRTPRSHFEDLGWVVRRGDIRGPHEVPIWQSWRRLWVVTTLEGNVVPLRPRRPPAPLPWRPDQVAA